MPSLAVLRRNATALLALGSLIAVACEGATASSTSSSAVASSLGPSSLDRPRTAFLSRHDNVHHSHDIVLSSFPYRRLSDLRGGASKRKKKTRTSSLAKTATGKTKAGAAKKAETEAKSGPLSEALKFYNGVPQLTRIYVSMVQMCTLLGYVLGEENTQAFLALDPIRTVYGLEIWRPITAASYLGPFSMSWLFGSYYLITYGMELEKNYGRANYLVFLLSQIALLSVFSLFMGTPFFANSVVTGMLHVLSRTDPTRNVSLLVLKVPYWMLPYGLAFVDMLKAQSLSACVPHVLGILAGHFYFFHRKIWPKTGGEDWLDAPESFVKLMDPDASNNPGKSAIAKALKARKRGKGKKLGTK